MMKEQILILAVLAVLAGSVFAMPTEPYRLAFITMPFYNALETDISVYNCWVQMEADAAGIGMGSGLGDGDTSWFVLGSTNDVDARDNSNTNPYEDGDGVPIYLTDGVTKIADDNWDLWDGDIDAPLDRLPDGTVSCGSLWAATGSGPEQDGTKGDIIALGPLGSDQVTLGNGGIVNEWQYTMSFGEPFTFHPLYAISEIIPEPATMCLFGLGGLLIRRKKKA